MRLLVSKTLGLLLWVLSAVPATGASTIYYSVTELPTLGNGVTQAYAISQASAINSSGQVTGYSATSEETHAFIYSNGVMIDLGTLSGYSTSYGTAVNTSGQVAGYTQLVSPTTTATHAFLYSDGVMIDLGALAGGSYSSGQSINASGQVVGYYHNASGGVSAFIYTSSVMTSIGTFPGGGDSGAFAINDSGQVTGYAYTSGGVENAFLYSNGTMTDLGTLSGYEGSIGFAINTSGQVAGYAYSHATDAEEAFLYSNGVMIDLGLGTVSNALAINASGDVVGFFTGPLVDTTNHYAFLYSGGKMINLNSAINPALGIRLVTATGINDQGQIVANGIDANGNDAAFLLTPAPNITIQTNPTGQQFSVDGMEYAATQTLPLLQGLHTIAVPPTQPGPGGSQYVFIGWSDGNTTNPRTITVGNSPDSFSATYIADFQAQYPLTISASPSVEGTVTATPPGTGGYYNSGTVVTISAMANNGYGFTGWTGNVASASSASTTVTMTQAQTVEADFTAAVPPPPVTVFSPNQAASGVPTAASLSWGPVTGATSYNVYFGTSSPPPQVTNTGGLSYSPQMAPATTYYWSITAVNGYGSTSSIIWSFTTAGVVYTYTGKPFSSIITAAPPPYTPPPPPSSITVSLTFAAPVPANLDLANELPTLIGGSMSDGNNYLAISSGFFCQSNLMLSTNNLGLPIAQWSIGTTCHGQVETYSMSTSTMTGQIEDASSQGPAGVYPSYSGSNTNDPGTWIVTVAPPPAVTVFSPQQGAINVSTAPSLTWGAVTSATSYIVYFGTSSPPPQVATNIPGTSSGTSYAPGTLLANTTYYWSVSATNALGSTPSAVWSFTTTPQTTGVTIQTSPAGLQFSVDGGAAQIAPQTVNLSQGTHSIAVATTQAGTPGTQYAFTSWSDGGAASHSITVGNSPATYIGTFGAQYLLTTTISPAGAGSLIANPFLGGYYNQGTSVQLTASSTAGYQFSSWGGDLNGRTNPQSITMNAPHSVTANFSPIGSSCSLILSPPSVTLPSTGTATVETCPNGSGQPDCGVTPETPASLTVTPSSGCGAWTATSSNPAVLQIYSGATGTGPGTGHFALLSNTHTSPQTYAITVSSGAAVATVSVTQAGSGDSVLYRQIYALYEQLLGRNPDGRGLAFWAGPGGTVLGYMADSFLTSPEAFNNEFAVMAAYQAATGAPPTFAQFSAAVGSIFAQTLTSAQLFNALIGPGFTAAQLYLNLLGRAPTPSELNAAGRAGLSGWFQTLIGYPGTATPMSTPNNEFQSTGIYSSGPDHSNALYVQMLYYVILGRDPEQSGLAFWEGIANSGGPGILFTGSAGDGIRLQILGPGTPNQGFIGSPEFQGLFAN